MACTIGVLEGRSGVRIQQELLRERRMTGLHFRAAGHRVSAMCLDEAGVRR